MRRGAITVIVMALAITVPLSRAPAGGTVAGPGPGRL
jgi:hypothetical protein